jgi:hypothetical protein
VDLDQYVLVSQRRVWHLARPHNLVASKTVDDDCLHDVFLVAVRELKSDDDARVVCSFGYGELRASRGGGLAG